MLSPDFSLGYYYLGVALTLAGRTDEAFVALQKESRDSWRLLGQSIALCSKEQQSERGEQADVDASTELAIPASAADALAKLEQQYADDLTYNIAYAHAYCGNADDAFQWLEKSVEVADPGLGGLLAEILLQNLHDDPRWLPFLRKLGNTKKCTCITRHSGD